MKKIKSKTVRYTRPNIKTKPIFGKLFRDKNSTAFIEQYLLADNQYIDGY